MPLVMVEAASGANGVPKTNETLSGPTPPLVTVSEYEADGSAFERSACENLEAVHVEVPDDLVEEQSAALRRISDQSQVELHAIDLQRRERNDDRSLRSDPPMLIAATSAAIAEPLFHGLAPFQIECS